jgi:oligopeptide/dipeptide ABC transporter ATP-binding protein
MSRKTVLEVADLQIEFSTRRGRARAVRGVSFRVDEGETLGLVGESGSGKSLSALAVMGLLPTGAGVTGGRVVLCGQDVLAQGEAELRRTRGSTVSMVFQDPMTSLNPSMAVGRQVAETLERHRGVTPQEALSRAVELLDEVGIPDPARRARSYPHQLSGGQRQRVMIAMAVACRPALLIADEPTSALDVTVQAQVLDLLRRLQQEVGMAILVITHDLGVVAGLADRVVVMYGGRVMEEGPATTLLATPRHPYTHGLLRSLPRLDRPMQTRLQQIDGVPPDIHQDLTGCPFRARCQYGTDRCARAVPPLEPLGDGTSAACWLMPLDGLRS